MSLNQSEGPGFTENAIRREGLLAKAKEFWKLRKEKANTSGSFQHLYGNLGNSVSLLLEDDIFITQDASSQKTIVDRAEASLELWSQYQDLIKQYPDFAKSEQEPGGPGHFPEWYSLVSEGKLSDSAEIIKYYKTKLEEK